MVVNQISWGRKQEMTSTTIPMVSTIIVFCEQPFHSLRIMPQTLEKTTLSAIRIQNASVSSVGDSARKPLPSARPKNYEYHNAPANRQNNRLLPQTAVFL